MGLYDSVYGMTDDELASVQMTESNNENSPVASCLYFVRQSRGMNRNTIGQLVAQPHFFLPVLFSVFDPVPAGLRGRTPPADFEGVLPSPK